MEKDQRSLCQPDCCPRTIWASGCKGGNNNDTSLEGMWHLHVSTCHSLPVWVGFLWMEIGVTVVMMYLNILKILLGETCWFSGVLSFFTSPHKVLDRQYLNRFSFETVSQTSSLGSDRKTAKVLSFNWRKIFPSSHFSKLSQISGVQCGTCRLFCERQLKST